MVHASFAPVLSLSFDYERASQTWELSTNESRKRPGGRMLDPDAELIDRIRNGAVDDFAALVQRHQSHVFALLYRYERDRQKLEDLAQETFIKAWRALESFDGRAPFQHWLSRIATHVALDHLRKQRRRPEVELESLGADVLDWLAGSEGHDDLQAAQAAELLALAMAQLSPADRVVLTMLELEGRPVKEIAERLGSSSVAVRVRAVRGRAKLRKILKKLTAERP
jgi:RNA polymerase sigma-70 factor (ECF subfamily)